MRYKVKLYHTEEGYSACVPALPGCWSEGDTEAEALANIGDDVQDYLAAWGNFGDSQREPPRDLQ